MGFQELHHTADCAVHVWAPDLDSLFAEAARAMNSVAGAQAGQVGRICRPLCLHGSDAEDLLVRFLTELVFLQEHERLSFDTFRLRIAAPKLTGEMEGGPLISISRPVKAVTFHNLEVRETDRGREVEIVFDI